MSRHLSKVGEIGDFGVFLADEAPGKVLVQGGLGLSELNPVQATQLALLLATAVRQCKLRRDPR